MPQKPSFFQKLTGANADEEENETQEAPLEDSVEAPAPAAFGQGKKAAVEKASKSKVRAKKIEAEEKMPEEEWAPESEGQLTIDVYQTPADVIIKSTVAGVNPEDIDVAISNDMVTIKGFRKKDEEVKTEDYYYQECYWGAFSRSVILPVDVVSDKAEASFKNGVLTIKLPKIERITTKKIKIKAV